MPGEKKEEIHGTIRYCPDCGGQRSENETSCPSCGSTNQPVDSKQTTPFAPAPEKPKNDYYTPQHGFNQPIAAATYFDSKTGQFFKAADDHPDETSDIDNLHRLRENIKDPETDEKKSPPSRMGRPYLSKEFNPATGMDTEWEERDFGGGEMKSSKPCGKSVDYKDIQRVMDCLHIDG